MCDLWGSRARKMGLGGMGKMLVVLIAFCISNVLSLPVYPYAPVPAPAPSYYIPPIDPYNVDPYAQQPYVSQPYYPTVDPYYQVPQDPYQPVDPYSPYQPQPDPYAQYQPQPDPYAQYQPQPDPYAPYQPQPDPYAQYQPQPDPYAPYVQPLPYPAVDPYYQIPQPAPYPTDPVYQPTPSYSPYSYQVESYNPPALAPVQQNYAVSYPQPSYPQPPPPASYAQVSVDQYEAITFHGHKNRVHCGVLSATNDEIYSSVIPGGINDVVPVGAYPWTQLLVDIDDGNVVCIATKIATGLSLTVASCVNGPASKYYIQSDWDILTNFSQYEAYNEYLVPVCSMWPLAIDSTNDQAQYAYGGSDAELILLATPEEASSEKVLCLPHESSNVPAPSPPPYGYPAPTPYPSPHPYTAYPQIAPPATTASECWVAGYRSSPTTILQNHPPPTPADNNQPQSVYQQQYYDSLDNSKVQRKALVRQIQCPPGYPNPGAEPDQDVCFVGVDGYDACVADKGTAIFCAIPDSKPYESGFADDPTSSTGALAPGTVAQTPPPSQPQPQKPPIQALPSPPKPDKKRAVLYALVKVPAGCASPQSQPSYQQPYQQQQQSNYIVGARICSHMRAAIVDLQWMAGGDFTCAAEKVDPNIISAAGSPSPSTGLAPLPPNPYQLTPLQPQLYDPSILDSYQQPYPAPYVPSYQPSPPPSYQPYQPSPVYQAPDVSSYNPYSVYPQPPVYQVPDVPSYNPYSVYPQQQVYQVPDVSSYDPYSLYPQQQVYQVPDVSSYNPYSVYPQPPAYQVPDVSSYNPYSVYPQQQVYQVPDSSIYNTYSVYPQQLYQVPDTSSYNPYAQYPLPAVY